MAATRIPTRHSRIAMRRAVAALLIACASLADAQSNTGAKPARLGSVAFANTGSRSAQHDFQQGIALLHSFQYREAATAFRAARDADSTFALPVWFEAFTYRHPLWAEEDVAGARRTLAALGATPNDRLSRAHDPRELAYAAAFEALFADRTEAERAGAFADSMRSIAAHYPKDLESTAFASLAIQGAVPFMPVGRDGPRAAAFAEAESLALLVFRAQPKHPGGAHYLIHADDDPARARRALEAAHDYAAIAPDASHAQHMPAHTFVQLGMWNEALTSTRDSWKSSRAEVARLKLPHADLGFHDLLWLQYVDLQLGKRAAARALIDSARMLLAGEDLSGSRADPLTAICSLAFQYSAETGDWKSWAANVGSDVAANGKASAADNPTARDRASRSACDYNRAAAMAMNGDTLAASHFDPAAGPRLSITRIRALELQALAARVRGDRAGMYSLLNDAVAAEQNASALGPPAALPALELLAAEQLADGNAVEAAKNYEAALVRLENRSSALLGLARARAEAGDAAGSRAAYQQLALNWKSADAGIAGQAATPGDKAALLALENGWATALVKRDKPYFVKTLAPGFVYTEDDRVSTREQVLRDAVTPGDTVTASHNEDMTVHLFGDVAAVTGILAVDGRANGKVYHHRYRFTDTWQKKNGRWQIIAAQDYLIPAK
jgi:hypothetical protein